MADNPQKAGVASSEALVSVVAILDSTPIEPMAFLRRLDTLMASAYRNYEVVLVDNGLPLASIVELRTALRSVPCVRILRLSRHHSHDAAVFAGLEAAIGDVVVVLDPVFDPIEVIPLIVEMSLDDNDIVQGISEVGLGGPWHGRVGRALFYWYNRRFLKVEIPTRATYLTGLTRRALNSLTSGERNHRYLRHLLRYIGYGIAEFPYTPSATGNTRRRSVKAGALDAIEMISSYSTHPLRVVATVGVVAGLLNLAYALYVVIVNLVRHDVAEGWTTTSLQLSVMFFLICVILATQSEYIARVLSESRREPDYVVMDVIESDTLISDPGRRNVSN